MSILCLTIAAAAIANAIRLTCQRAQSARWTCKAVKPAARAQRIKVIL